MNKANSNLDDATMTGATWTETATSKSLVVPVLRDERFQRYNPDYFTVTRTSTDTLEKFELRLQSLAHRELSHQLNLAAGDGLGIVGREVRVEVSELAAIVMTARQMTKLRDNLSQAIAGATPRTEDEAKDRLAQLAAQIEVAETELARRASQMRGWGSAAPDRSDFANLSARVEALAEQVAPRTEPADAASVPIAAWAFLGEPVPVAPHKAAFGRAAAWAGLGTVGVAGMLLVLVAGGTLVWPMHPPAMRGAAQAAPLAAPVQDARPAMAETSTPLPALATQSARAAQSPEPAPAPPAPPPVIAPAPAPEVAASAVGAGAHPIVAPAGSLAKVELAPSQVAVTSEAVAVPLPSVAEKAKPAARLLPAPAAVPSGVVAVSLPSMAEKAKLAARPAPAAAPAPHEAIFASAASWVHVWNAAGITYISRVLKPGETWPVPTAAGLQMTTGNAGSTYLVVDGVKGQPLGSSGAVRSEAIAPPAGHDARNVTSAARPNPG